MLLKEKKIEGFIAAALTPMNESGDIDISRVPTLANFMIDKGIEGLYINGSTGEGSSLTPAERITLAESWCKAVRDRVPVIVHVGDTSIRTACDMAVAAAEAKADAVAALPPYYFKPENLNQLILFLEEIAGKVPELPFYYYHLPSVTGVDFDMVRFMELASMRIPNFKGIKYSAFKISECQACVDYTRGEKSIFWGFDEAILTGLSIGCSGGIGSTYNFALPLYQKIKAAWNNNDVELARNLQSKAVSMVRVCEKYGSHRAFKAMMKIVGVNCGPCRLPIRKMTLDEESELKADMEAICFFKWGVV